MSGYNGHMNEPPKIGYTLKPYCYTRELLLSNCFYSGWRWVLTTSYICASSNLIYSGVILGRYKFDVALSHFAIALFLCGIVWAILSIKSLRHPKVAISLTHIRKVRFDPTGIFCDGPDHARQWCAWSLFDSVYRVKKWTVLVQSARPVVMIPDHAFESQASFEAFKLEVRKVKGGTRLKF